MNHQHQKLKQQMLAGIGGSIVIIATAFMRHPLHPADIALIILGAATGGYCLATLRLLTRGELVIRQPTPEEDQSLIRKKALFMAIVVLIAAVCVYYILRK